MPKIRTRKTAAKRFTVSASGKLLRNTTGRNHLMMKKSGSRKRRLNMKHGICTGDAKRMQVLLAGRI
ncbi:MAG: 50S ribosomal protein L35 [Armatimonadetes bacterium]|nr:50S ribosomal protein L35 [Armatimonadota bacterium]